ncbi:hypothetical protein DB35_04665 [Streptomyces abyssalis]|uniref:Uncharacterized protein n=1 Tax=Streptomyces abyssalis TaxID=933944 RepID=A0A1E7JQJ7_9ACTN|nr:hypothetical protein [Streptomyces abyssalis]OEU90493.1 hypothetical protein AN215_13755 [Streptomyces abyssalis]OEU95230.1 hypothetical protein DB35_04665 [Streptomyces abyssalis]OEV27086.1 hypothetical protein AN219_23720 [Streptomyces nanshensis]
MRHRKSTLVAAATAAALIPLSLTGAANAASGKAPVTAKDRAAKAYAESWQERPGDYLALEKAVKKAGGDSLRFNVPAVGMENATASQVQKAYAKAENAHGDGDVSTKDVPSDAFQVSGSWYHTQDQYGEWWTASGHWNFRDDFVNGSAPDDASGIALDEVDKKCWENDGDNLLAADWQNEPYDQMWRHSSSPTSNIWNIRDRVQGFAMKADHGTHLLHLRRVGYNCDNNDKMAASYHYEHNQDGSGGWGASISIGVMTLSYNGSGGDTMQKSPKVFYNNPAS